jgi:tryptophan-rich sensory protein
MSKAKYLILFLVINFGGLAIGAWLMNDGPQSSWYANLNKAPWTPPGWVFGAAWTTIMILFSIYLAYLFTKSYTDKKLSLYIIQVVLNVSWNYIFFNQHQVLLAQVVITLLTALIFYFFFTFFKEQKSKSYLLLPYMIWLCIATSLNLYVLVNN